MLLCLAPPAVVDAMERTEVKMNLISEQLGLSWAGECWDASSTFCRVSLLPALLVLRVGPRAPLQRGRHQPDPRGEPQLPAGPERRPAQPVGQQGGPAGQE